MPADINNKAIGQKIAPNQQWIFKVGTIGEIDINPRSGAT